MKKFKMPERLLLVEWIDASSVLDSNGSWTSWKKLQKEAVPATIRSIGYVVKDEPTFIVLTSQICVEDGTNDGNVTILRVNILHAWDLTTGAEDGSIKGQAGVSDSPPAQGSTG
jgi:hypothetical protein